LNSSHKPRFVIDRNNGVSLELPSVPCRLAKIPSQFLVILLVLANPAAIEHRPPQLDQAARFRCFLIDAALDRKLDLRTQ
jgi:hypothetical protein